MKKALKISLIVLLALLGIFSIVAYILWKEETTYIFERIIDFINKPLPIIGVSVAIICLFVFKCFVATRFGKKAINEYKEENRVLKKEIEELGESIAKFKDTTLEELFGLGGNLDEYKQILLSHLELSKNIKDKDLIKYLKGEQSYGEEEIESNPEEETL